MNRRILKRDKAKRDLVEISVFIGQSSVRSAQRFLNAAERAFEQLARRPQLGSQWETSAPDLPGLRLWPIRSFPKYLSFYLPLEKGIDVIRVLHGSRDLESALSEE